MRGLLLLPLLALCLAAAPAGADESLVGTACAGDADCPLAFTCETVQVRCTEQVPDCACPPCDEGEDCRSCDCGEWEPPEDDCTPGTQQRCVFEPQDCTADADCATPGFVCEQREECSGSGGCACPDCDPDAGDCPPCDCEVEEEVCTTIGGYCLPPMDRCATDADCSDGWGCADIGGSGGASDCEDCACRPCPDGDPECSICDCESSCGGGGAGGTSEGVCLPPGYEEQIAEGGGGVGNDAGTGVPRDDELAGEADDMRRDYVVSVQSCSAAGAAPATSILLAGAALAWVLRRR